MFVESPIPTASHWKDLRGGRFGNWAVVAFAGVRNGNSTWLCKCNCGVESVVGSPGLKSGTSRSCGCQRDTEINTTHGGARGSGHHDIYTCWWQMQQRCRNPKHNRYKNYGGRGITVCDRWLKGERGIPAFTCFLADMGERPSKKHSVDRRDVNGNYEPGNCRWATAKEQGANKTTNRYFEWRGEKRALVSICDMEGVNYNRTLGRLQEGWDIHEAVTVPKYGRYGKAA